MAFFTAIILTRPLKSTQQAGTRTPDRVLRLLLISDMGWGANSHSVSAARCKRAWLCRAQAATIAKQALWPAETVDGIAYPIGDGGYSTNSALAAALGANNSSGNYYISYVAVNDADSTAIPAGARELTYNGFALGTPPGGSYNNSPAWRKGNSPSGGMNTSITGRTPPSLQSPQRIPFPITSRARRQRSCLAAFRYPVTVSEAPSTRTIRLAVPFGLVRPHPEKVTPADGFGIDTQS